MFNGTNKNSAGNPVSKIYQLHVKLDEQKFGSVDLTCIQRTYANTTVLIRARRTPLQESNF